MTRRQKVKAVHREQRERKRRNKIMGRSNRSGTSSFDARLGMDALSLMAAIMLRNRK
jgi:hypothetical protein